MSDKGSPRRPSHPSPTGKSCQQMFLRLRARSHVHKAEGEAQTDISIAPSDALVGRLIKGCDSSAASTAEPTDSRNLRSLLMVPPVSTEYEEDLKPVVEVKMEPDVCDRTLASSVCCTAQTVPATCKATSSDMSVLTTATPIVNPNNKRSGWPQYFRSQWGDIFSEQSSLEVHSKTLSVNSEMEDIKPPISIYLTPEEDGNASKRDESDGFNCKPPLNRHLKALQRPMKDCDCRQGKRKKHVISIHMTKQGLLTTPYFCSKCDMGFHQKEAFDLHMRRRHRDSWLLERSCGSKLHAQQNVDEQTSDDEMGELPKFDPLQTCAKESPPKLKSAQSVSDAESNGEPQVCEHQYAKDWWLKPDTADGYSAGESLPHSHLLEDDLSVKTSLRRNQSGTRTIGEPESSAQDDSLQGSHVTKVPNAGPLSTLRLNIVNSAEQGVMNSLGDFSDSRLRGIEHQVEFDAVTQLRTEATEDLASDRRDEEAPSRVKPGWPALGEKPEEKLYVCSMCGEGVPLLADLWKHMRTHMPHVCPICNEAFSEPCALKLHVLGHAIKKSHKCGDCGKVFSQVNELTRHKQSHTGKKPHICSVCKKGFTRLANLNRHMMAHEGENVHACTTCGRSFMTVASLKGHLLSHTGEKPHACSYCGKTFPVLRSLKVHVRTHTDKMTHVCPDCGKGFIYLSQLNVHSLTHGEENQRAVHLCSQCGKVYAYATGLRRHVLLHGKGKKHVCSVCGKVFALRDYLRTHFRSVHSEQKPHMCSVCGKRFSMPKYLKCHMFTHTGDCEKPHSCLDCGKSFSYASVLKTHMLVHTREMPHECSDCGKGFRSVKKFKSHMLTHITGKIDCDKELLPSSNLKSHVFVRTEDKPYICSQCNKGFRDTSSLEQHVTIHTGEKPYECSDCGKRYRLLASLKTHKISHMIEKPNRCSICDKGFDKLSALNNHARFHTREKPCVCSQCGDRFRWNANLRRHIQMKHTEDRPHVCPMCGKCFAQTSDLKKHIARHDGEKSYKCNDCIFTCSTSLKLKQHIGIHFVENNAQILQFP